MQTQLPNPLDERRSDEREVFTLVNALRRALLQLTGGGTGLCLFASFMGRGDTLQTLPGGVETIGLAFELPAVYPTFNLNWAGQGEDTGGLGTFRIRLGGTWGNLDGTVVATMTAASTSFVRCETDPVVTGNTSTLLQMTLQASGPTQTARFRGGCIVGN